MCIVRVKAIRGETSGMCPDRVVWLRDLAEESSAAIRDKADLHGICLFPARVMPSWYTGDWLPEDFFNLVEEHDQLRRLPYQPYIDELRRWQKELRCIPPVGAIDAACQPLTLTDLRVQPDGSWCGRMRRGIRLGGFVNLVFLIFIDG